MTEVNFFKKNFPEYVTEMGECLSPYWDLFDVGVEYATYELEKACDETEELLDKQIEATYKVVEELNKAKEHIRTLISCLIDWVQEGDKDYCHIAEAEQFLKEVSE